MLHSYEVVLELTPDAPVEALAACLRQQVGAGGWVTVEGKTLIPYSSWTEVAPAVRSRQVLSYSVRVPETSYHCAFDKSEAACLADAFCAPYYGSKLVSLGREACLEKPAFVRCYIRSRECRPGYSAAGDYEDRYNCWVFEEDCPAGDLRPLGSCKEETYMNVWDCDEYVGTQTGGTCGPGGSCLKGLDCIDNLPLATCLEGYRCSATPAGGNSFCTVTCAEDTDYYPGTECVKNISRGDTVIGVCAKPCDSVDDCFGERCVLPPGAPRHYCYGAQHISTAPGRQ